MVGYCDNGYRLWNLNIRKIEFVRNIVFDEKLETSDNEQPKHIIIYIIISPEQRQTYVNDVEENNEHPDNYDQQGDFYGFPDAEEEKSQHKRTIRKRKYLDDFVSFAFDELALSASYNGQSIIHQEGLIKRIINKFNMTNAKGRKVS